MDVNKSQSATPTTNNRKKIPLRQQDYLPICSKRKNHSDVPNEQPPTLITTNNNQYSNMENMSSISNDVIKKKPPLTPYFNPPPNSRNSDTISSSRTSGISSDNSSKRKFNEINQSSNSTSQLNDSSNNTLPSSLHNSNHGHSQNMIVMGGGTGKTINYHSENGKSKNVSSNRTGGEITALISVQRKILG